MASLQPYRDQGKTIVLVTGCFDILHTEHRKFLQKAKKKGNILLVGMESDKRVRELKGQGRPVNKIKKRTKQLVDTNIPDYVFVLPEHFSATAEHERLIARIRPDILAVSAHTLHQGKKKEMVERYGGELRVVLPYNPGFSTSRLLSEV